MDNKIVQIEVNGKHYEVKTVLSYSQKNELAMRAFAAAYDIDEELGIVVPYLNSDAIIAQILLPEYLVTPDGDMFELDYLSFMDKYQELYNYVRYEKFDGSYMWNDMDSVIEKIDDIKSITEKRVSAAASLSTRLNKLMSGLFDVDKMMASILNAEDVSNKMLSAAHAFKESEGTKPAKKAGNSILNFAKK